MLKKNVDVIINELCRKGWWNTPDGVYCFCHDGGIVSVKMTLEDAEKLIATLPNYVTAKATVAKEIDVFVSIPDDVYECDYVTYAKEHPEMIGMDGYKNNVLCAYNSVTELKIEKETAKP